MKNKLNTQYHILPHIQKDWCVKRKGNTNCSAKVKTRLDGIQWCLNRKNTDTIILHKKDGRIEYTFSIK